MTQYFFIFLMIIFIFITECIDQCASLTSRPTFLEKCYLFIHTLGSKWRPLKKNFLFKCVWNKIENSGKIREFHEVKNAGTLYTVLTCYPT